LYGAAATLRGMEQAARAAGFLLGVSVLEPDSARSDVVARLSRPGEAVMVIAYDAAGVRALHALPPDVAVTAAAERQPEPTGDHTWQVWLDDRAAAGQATRYLLSLGHPTVHYLAIPSSTSTVAERTRGWADALGGAGRPVPEPLQGGWTPRSGYLAARTLLADPSVTALLCGNDDLALGVMRAARELGRNIPGDLSVVGFDDTPAAAYLNPSLTTVRLDFEGLGRACFGLLHKRLEPDAAPPTGEWAEPELIVRESAGPAPRPSG
jgi:DNA-binding LacI/PurR family transcriptional regulator